MCHPEMLLPIPAIDDPVERFVSVVKFYLSGWHIRPPLVACGDERGAFG
jgi:oxysterol-binding protein-related protein 8